MVTPNNFTNAYVNYRVLSSWSADDLKNYGPSCLFSPDSNNTWIYNSVDCTTLATNDSRLVNGNGICNNSIIPKWTLLPGNATAPQNVEFEWGNKGLLERVNMINHKPNTAKLTADATTTVAQNLAAL